MDATIDGSISRRPDEVADVRRTARKNIGLNVVSQARWGGKVV